MLTHLDRTDRCELEIRLRLASLRLARGVVLLGANGAVLALATVCIPMWRYVDVVLVLVKDGLEGLSVAGSHSG